MNNRIVLSVISLAAVALITACAPHPQGERPVRNRLSVDEVFQQADVNHDGVLTKAELAVALP